MSTRAYLRLSPRTFHDKAVVDRYPPGAFAAFTSVLCLADEQPERGRFRSEKLLRLLLDEPMDGVRLGWGKWVPYLLDHGDLERRPDGSLYVAGWDEWQEGDVTVAERMARLRSKKSNGSDRNAEPTTVTPTVTVPTVSVPSDGPRNSRSGGDSRDVSRSGGETGARNGESAEPYRTLEELTDHFPIQRVEANAIRTLDALTDRRGIPAVVTALREAAPGIPTQPPGPWQLIAAARNLLEPFAPSNVKALPKGKGFNPTSEEAWDAFGGKTDVA